MSKALLLFGLIFTIKTLSIDAQCKTTILAMKTIDTARFTKGPWYVSKSSFIYSQPGVSCAYAELKAGSPSLEIKVMLSGKPETMLGTMDMKPGVAECTIRIPITSLGITVTLRSKVVETDYDKYAIIYSCGSVGILPIQELLIVTRTNYILDATSEAKVNQKLVQIGLNKMPLKGLPDSNCKN